MAILTVSNLSLSFGGLKAVDSFNITIEQGELYGLIGPN
jgi:branched-chain amino acid transport system ATP-binding protein